MRVSTPFTQEISVRAMLEQQVKVAKSQTQMASGLRVETPSDDPPAAVRALVLQESIEQTKQYQVNVTMARSRLSQEEAALDGIGNTLQRVNELAIRGANDSLNASDRRSIEVEARQLLEQLKDLMNAKNDSGEFMFGGFVSTTQPFSLGTTVGSPTEGSYIYRGDTNQHSTWIGPDFSIKDTDPGDTAFTINTAATPTVPPVTVWPPSVPPSPPYAVRAWNNQAPTPPATATTPEANILNVVFNFAENMRDNRPDSMDIERIQRSMTQVLDVRVTIGARLSALDNQENLQVKFVADEKGYLSTTQDLDYSEAISRFNLQSFALQTAQQAYSKVQKLSLFNYL